jgi:hypothetical protein
MGRIVQRARPKIALPNITAAPAVAYLEIAAEVGLVVAPVVVPVVLVVPVEPLLAVPVVVEAGAGALIEIRKSVDDAGDNKHTW